MNSRPDTEKKALGLDQMQDEAQVRLATQKLYDLLSARVARYTMGDHSSIPSELAAELLRSVVFTLKAGGCTGQAIATADLDAAFCRGLQWIVEKKARTRRLWERVCIEAPDFGNIAMRDTLQSIGGFFDRYDPDFFAHSIPCDIDYQLCRPVLAQAQGVVFIDAYLGRLARENAMLRRFAHGAVERLLAADGPDYCERINNLCEPVVINLLGWTLLGLEPDAQELLLGQSQQDALFDMLAPLSKDALSAALAGAAKRLCAQMGIRDPIWRADVAWMAGELAPRIMAARESQKYSRIFLA